jgi:hypothetical protein
LRKKIASLGILLLCVFGFAGNVARAQVTLLEATENAGFSVTCPEGAAYCSEENEAYTAAGTKYFILNILGYVLKFVAVLAVLMLVVSGIRFVIAGGNQESISAAKKNALWSLGGLLIVIISLLLVENVGKIVNQSAEGGCRFLVEDGHPGPETKKALDEAPQLAAGYLREGPTEKEKADKIKEFQRAYNLLECNTETGKRVDKNPQKSDENFKSSPAATEIQENPILESTESGEALEGVDSTFKPSVGVSGGGEGSGIGLDLTGEDESAVLNLGSLIEEGSSSTSAPSNPTDYSSMAAAAASSSRICIGNTLSSETLTACENNDFQVSTEFCLGSIVSEDLCQNVRNGEGEDSKLCYSATATRDAENNLIPNLDSEVLDEWDYCKYGCENSRCITAPIQSSTLKASATTKRSLISYNPNSYLGGGGDFMSGGGGNLNVSSAGLLASNVVTQADFQFDQNLSAEENMANLLATVESAETVSSNDVERILADVREMQNLDRADLLALYQSLRNKGMSDAELRALFAEYGFDWIFAESAPFVEATSSIDANGKAFFNYADALARQPQQLSEEGPKEIFLIASLLTLGILGLRKIVKKKLPA